VIEDGETTGTRIGQDFVDFRLQRTPMSLRGGLQRLQNAIVEIPD
jgi:hypothetical protein